MRPSSVEVTSLLGPESTPKRSVVTVRFAAARASVQTIVRTLARPGAQFFGGLVNIIAQAIWISNNSPMSCIH
jgi:hypothetical protein